MGKKKEPSLVKEATIERLKQYYPYDEESKTFTIPFHYEKLDELLVNKKQVTKKPKVDGEFVFMVSEILTEIPRGYKADIEVYIDDYQGYDRRMALSALKDVAIDRQFVGSEQYKWDSIRSGIITLVGICWLLLSFIGQSLSWFGSMASYSSNIISGLLNVFAVVFIWEAVGLLIIHSNPFIKAFRHIISKMRYIIVKDKEGEERKLLSEIGYSFSHYRTRATSEYLIMIASFAFFALVMIRLLRYVNTIVILESTIANHDIIISSFLLTLMTVLGAFGVLIYRGHLKLLFPCVVVNSLLIVASIINLVFTYVNNDPVEIIFTAIIIMIMVVAFTIGLALRFYLFKKKNLI